MTQSSVEYQRDFADTTKEAPILVLHVDDDASFLKVAKPILEMQGNLRVETASSVEEAMEKMKQREFDAIVCDYVMPEKDGLQFLKELRDNESRIPFIVFTGKGREEIAIKALNFGADQYFNKIGNPETVYGELAHGIHQIVERRKAEERLNAFMNSAPDAFALFDSELNLIDVNQVGLRMFPAGTKKEEVIGRNITEMGTRFHDEYEEVVKTGKPFSAEDVDSIPRFGSLYFSVSAFKAGSGLGIIARNITERKKADEALEESEERFKDLFENAGDGILTLDLYGRVTSANRKIEEISGLSREEIIGKHPTQFANMGILGLKDLPMLLEALATRIKGQPTKVYEFKIKNKKGQERLVEFRGSLIRQNGKPVGILEIIRDVTERKKAEEALKQSEEKYRGIIELAPDGIATMNMKGVITSVNPAFLRLTGFSEDEIVGKHFTKIGTLRARDLPRYIKLFGSILIGKISSPIEFTYIRKDGTQCWGEAHTSLLKEGGKTVGFQAILRDITGRKKTLEKLKTLNEKLSVVGKVTRHDIRNKLQAVTSKAYLAKQTLTGDNRALEYLKDIGSSCGQMERVLDFATSYEKLGVEELIYINVEKNLEETVMLFSDLHGVKVVNDCHGLTVFADSLLQQLFYNLIHNSLTHGEKVSQVRVYYEEAGKDKLKLVYEDDGVGIPKNEKEKIFEEGYGKGTGYGLYLIRKMCEVYGWAIKETGKHGKGAQFTLTIPRLGQDGRESFRVQ